MKLPTKALIAVLVVTALSVQFVSPAAAASENTVHQRMKRHVERVQRHHDRKLELRSSTLGMDAAALKAELKTKTFQRVLKEHGFKNREAFYKAVQGKIRNELRKRGFSAEQIEHILLKRQQRAQQDRF